MNAWARNHVNLSYPMNIIALPTDVLRQIPTSYRMWKLLQLTCHRLNNGLGDYHKAKNLMCIIGGERVTYDTFARGLILTMIRSDNSVCASHTLCGDFEWPMIKNIGMHIRQHAPIIQWNGRILTYFQIEHPMIYIEKRVANNATDAIYVGNILYAKGRSHMFMGPLYSRLYDELPMLFSMIRVPKSLTPADLCKQ